MLADKASRKITSYYLLYTKNLLKADFNKHFKAVREDDGKIKFTISLDFAESLIRRGVKGIEFVEVEEDV
jgi:hypothetical protein